MSIGESQEELVGEFRNTIELLPSRLAEWRHATTDNHVLNENMVAAGSTVVDLSEAEPILVLDQSGRSPVTGTTAATAPIGTNYSYEMAKRLFDVVVAATALLAVSPILLTAILAVRLTSPGPAIFRQPRVGRHGELFTILKLRSMYIDADHSRQREFNEAELRGELDDVEEFTLANDNRVTPVGLFIRKFSIDELPQLWNVLRGDMSLVGPRPSCDWEVELYEGRYRKRLDVRPGITGLWQVTGRRTIDMRGMLELDLQYVDNASFTGDVILLAKTVPAVLKGTGAA